ncbi:MAG: CPBP family intramembrane metalloprotease [Sphingobacterium sp.]|nr:CPBP family intramembrane metalloprotease [Sphingobacterium sp.]
MERKKITVVGFVPRKKSDISQLLLGIGSGALMFTCNIIIIVLLTNLPVNYRTVNYLDLIPLFVFNLASAFIQEFTFRGYPFLTLLEKYGAWGAQICIAIPFGLMHIHTNMDIKTIILTMLTTGIGSLIFGAAYIKTRQLFLPTGIHTGWNFTQQIFLEVWHNRPDQHIHQVNNAFLLFVIPYLVIMLITFFLIQKYCRRNTI